jgi:hypothetical protein
MLGTQQVDKSRCEKPIATGLTAAAHSPGCDAALLGTRSGSYRAFAIFLGAAIITAWLVWSCWRLETMFVAHHGYFYDAAAYLQQHIALYHSYLQQGAWTTICNDFVSNNRCPLRTLPYLIAAPRLLIQQSGHLWTEIPFLFSLVLSFGWVVARRTRSVLLALSAMSTFCAMPYLYDPMHGIAAFWLDLTAAFALGSAVLALVSFHETRQNRWLLAFGLLASATVLCRWWSTIFLVAFSSLALPAVLTGERLSFRARFVGLACALLGALPGMIFSISSFPSAWAYYKVAAIALDHKIPNSISWLATSLPTMVGAPVLALLLLLIGFNLANWCQRAKSAKTPSNWQLYFICFWFPASLFVVTCLVCRICVAQHALTYFLPALVIAAFVPLRSFGHHHWWSRAAVSSFLLIMMVSTAASAYETFRKVAKGPSAAQQVQKRTDAELSALIAATGSKSFLEFDTQTIYPQLEAFYRHGIYCPESACFSIHEYHMKGRYPNKSASEVAKAAYDDVCKTVELVAVFEIPGGALGKFNNLFSERTAFYISDAVRQDSSWRQVGRVQSPRGWLAVYQNQALLKKSRASAAINQ